ncbi:Sulfotransferase domain protein [Rosistilla carotiformis]|uniref:Sulfotransferase domain protein n=1 Tax=Rosistilla carotiformis TaxID=2528017 RepID=A0A518JLE3_9BACT|nr:sulfotransferase [Rosistilla carotiformis]QDV66362.1 Sulfotransferase domain protein [Rosistilla carotiformis]
MKTPVFIVGEARSGTSIAHRCLLLHPSFRLANGSSTALAETSAFVHPTRIVDDFREDAGLWEYLLGRDDIGSEIVSKLRPWRNVAMRTWPAYRLAKRFRMGSRNLWNAGRYPEILRCYFAAAQRARGQERLLDKSPTHVFVIPEIFWTYPDAKVIYLMRDPVDTFASYKKRYEREKAAGASEQSLQWLHVTIDGLTTRLRKNWKRVQRAHQRWPDHVAVIRYDAFVGDYDNVMPALLRWLDEPEIVVQPTQTDESWSADPQLMAGLRPRAESNDEVISKSEVEKIHALMSDAESILPRFICHS